MSDDFRIPRFISTNMLLLEEFIMLAGAWFYADFSVSIKIALTMFCILSQIIVHNIKDSNYNLYIGVDLVLVTLLSFAMCYVYLNYYVILVVCLFYYVKCIFFRNKRLVFEKMVTDVILNILGFHLPFRDQMVHFDAFVTAFVCLIFVMMAGLVAIVIDQIDIMIKESKEQETSMDDLLDLVESKVLDAEEANKAKGQFLASMSHEIRTPINAVLGMDTMILRDCKDDDIKQYALDIQSAGNSLLSIINDILDFSKIESGKMELVPVDFSIANIITDVVNMIKPKASDKKLQFISSIDETMPYKYNGDEVRIKQILINLLTNAVKYTHEGSVTLTINAERLGDSANIHFAVKDTGIGIKEEDISKLSEEFVRIEEARNRNIEGTGLGINIVISLLKLMGSKLEVDSVYGEGSTFHFTLNLPVIDGAAIGDYEARNRDNAKKSKYVVSFTAPNARLLMVDDTKLNRKVFANLLRDMKCTINLAESGMECLDMVVKEKYDIIFMDHMMPEMDGVETFKRMQAFGDYLNANTPVVVLTANAISGAKEQYLAAGFDDFLAKPINYTELEGMIDKFLPDELKNH